MNISNKKSIPHDNFTAVILCGGLGSRLMPLTATTPKPQLTIGGEAVIIHILKLLAKHGITSAVLTLGYMGNSLEEFVKNSIKLTPSISHMNISFYHEATPLGSAGGLKHIENLIPGDFMVLCGDAWCDFNLNSPIELLYKKECASVIVTADHPSPLSYGLVMSDSEGRVTDFCEKPAWPGVFTKQVNTGIYVFKNEVLNLIPSGKSDFARDVFPSLLKRGKEVFAHPLEGIWYDIGDPVQYYNCNMTVSGGKNIISPFCRIDRDAKVEASVLLENCHIQKKSIIKGTVLGKNVIVEEGCKIKEGCIIGENSVVKSGTVINQGVLIPQGSIIEPDSVISNPLHGIKLFKERCMSFPAQYTTEPFCRALGFALGNYTKGMDIAASNGRGNICPMVKRHLLSTIDSEFSDDWGNLGINAAKFGAVQRKKQLVIYVSEYVDCCMKKWIRIDFFDQNGIYPGAQFESKVHYGALYANDSPSLMPSVPYRPSSFPSTVNNQYIEYLNSICYPPRDEICVDYEGYCQDHEYLRAVFGPCCDRNAKYHFTISTESGLGITGMRYNGLYLDNHHILCMVILYYIENGIMEIPLPHRTPFAIKSFVKENGARLSLYSLSFHDPKEGGIRSGVGKLPALTDSIAAIIHCISYITLHELNENQVNSLLPPFSSVEEEMYLPHGGCQSILDALISKNAKHDGEGFIINNGKIRLIPESNEILAMYCEASGESNAKDMAELAKEYITSSLENNTTKTDIFKY